VCELTERQPKYLALTKRVLAKRASDRTAAASGVLVAAAPVRRMTGPAPAPRPGARPERRRRR
jgi:preprotein translocase subunit SecF